MAVLGRGSIRDKQKVYDQDGGAGQWVHEGQAQFMTKMAVLGRGSMRDKQKV